MKLKNGKEILVLIEPAKEITKLNTKEFERLANSDKLFDKNLKNEEMKKTQEIKKEKNQKKIIAMNLGLNYKILSTQISRINFI